MSIEFDRVFSVVVLSLLVYTRRFLQAADASASPKRSYSFSSAN
ncbi:MAG: hypothetical protein AAF512_24250 [Pseudomonadota bacterium]